MNYGLAFTGGAAITGSLVIGTTFVAIGVGIVAAAALAGRFLFRRGKTAGDV